MFGQALVKPRRRGWPVLFPGEYIDEYFNEKAIGHCETLEQVQNGVKYLIYFKKEDNYMTKLLPCHGDCIQVDDHGIFCNISNGDHSRSRMIFKYHEFLHTTTKPSIW